MKTLSNLYGVDIIVGPKQHGGIVTKGSLCPQQHTVYGPKRDIVWAQGYMAPCNTPIRVFIYLCEVIGILLFVLTTPLSKFGLRLISAKIYL